MLFSASKHTGKADICREGQTALCFVPRRNMAPSMPPKWPQNGEPPVKHFSIPLIHRRGLKKGVHLDGSSWMSLKTRDHCGQFRVFGTFSAIRGACPLPFGSLPLELVAGGAAPEDHVLAVLSFEGSAPRLLGSSPARWRDLRGPAKSSTNRAD